MNDRPLSSCPCREITVKDYVNRIRPGRSRLRTAAVCAAALAGAAALLRLGCCALRRHQLRNAFERLSGEQRAEAERALQSGGSVGIIGGADGPTVLVVCRDADGPTAIRMRAEEADKTDG